MTSAPARVGVTLQCHDTSTPDPAAAKDHRPATPATRGVSGPVSGSMS